MSETIEEYKGYTIKAWHDTDAENPFENWDGCIPLISDSGSRGYYKDHSKGEIIDYLRNFLTYNRIKRNQTRIFKMMGFSVEDERGYAKSDEVDLTDRIQNDYLYDWLNDGIENMETFCIEFDIKHYQNCSRGYSQSDWAEIFICWTPEFEKITGRDYKSITEEDFKSGFDLWTSWAWGDVYGFEIEEMDSCGGFYGDDHEKSGLLEHAREEIDATIKHNRKTKQSKLKTLVKNRVPLAKRESILN
jgi:hypothetical protein